MASSCQKAKVETPVAIDPSLVGEWHLTEATAEGIDVHTGVDVYLKFNSDSTFELYQKSGTQSVRYSRYAGSCSVLDGLLSGVYSTGDEWGSKYTYNVSQNSLILTSYNLIEVQKYERKDIPAEVRNNADDLTKSLPSENTPIL